MSEAGWSVSVESILASSPDAVWHALTQTAGLERWFCDRVVGSCQTDSPISFHWTLMGSGVAHEIQGHWGVMETARRLQWVLSQEHSGQEVVWRLTPYREGTRLQVVHSGSGPVPETALSVQRGWEHGMANLRAVMDDQGERIDARRYYRDRGWL